MFVNVGARLVCWTDLGLTRGCVFTVSHSILSDEGRLRRVVPHTHTHALALLPLPLFFSLASSSVVPLLLLKFV